MSGPKPSASEPLPWLALAVVATAAAASLGAYFVAPDAAFFVAFASLGGASTYVALRSGPNGVAAPAPETRGSETERSALDRPERAPVAQTEVGGQREIILVQAVAVDVTERMRTFLHELKNRVAPIVLDVEYLAETEGGEIEAAWRQMRDEFVESIRALESEFDEVNRIIPLPKGQTSIEAAIARANETGAVPIVAIGDDAKLMIEGGEEGLAHVFVHLARDAVARGAEKLQVTSSKTTRRIAIRFDDDGGPESRDAIVIAAARATALLSGGRAAELCVEDGRAFELDLFRAGSV